MASRWKIFGLLMYKNLIIRKRHWRMTIFLQALVPIALVALLQAIREFNVKSPVAVNVSTLYPVQTQQDLMRKIDNDKHQVHYVPKNAHTDKIMFSVRKCIDRLQPDNIKGFTNETEMMNTYVRYQKQNPFLTVVGVVFEQYNKLTLKYKLRHSRTIPNNLYKSLSEFINLWRMSPTIYFENIPLAQVQICVDEAFIKKTATNSNVK
ncbi:PREDICTED: uncharacterized protein LOC105460476, partial [Wasmannia auropunctata]|uniref:uncharacterized protein LOC105460476 n=1 Tax=Wasmannia auropunctata TaxID=64793 RepID=UPI0005ED873E